MYKILAIALTTAALSGAAFAQTSGTGNPGNNPAARDAPQNSQQRLSDQDRCNAMTGTAKEQCLRDTRPGAQQGAAPGSMGSGSAGPGARGAGPAGGPGAGSAGGAGSGTGSSTR
jgi:hypothetical protein